MNIKTEKCLMTRKDYAQHVFALIKRILPNKDSNQLWIAIAETDDETLKKDYEKLITKNYSLREWCIYKDEQQENKKK